MSSFGGLKKLMKIRGQMMAEAAARWIGLWPSLRSRRWKWTCVKMGSVDWIRGDGGERRLAHGREMELLRALLG